MAIARDGHANGGAFRLRRVVGAFASVLLLVVPATAVLATGGRAPPSSTAGVPRTVTDSSPTSVGSGGSPVTTTNWSPLPPSPEPQPYGRAYAALGFDALGGAGILFGGEGPGGVVQNDTWVNDGDLPGRWSDLSDKAKGSPPPLMGASLLYDRADGYFVLFGGRFSNGTDSGSTWELRNLTQWVDVSSSQSISPAAQSGAGFVYDEADGYGLLVSTVGPDSTWTFTHGRWAIVPSPSGPGSRAGAAFVYDPIDAAALLYGGRDASGPRSDTWEYAGGAWKSVDAGIGPPSAATLPAAFDPRGSGVAVFAGTDGTWEYSHGRWAAGSPQTTGGPVPRSGAAFYFDSILGYAVLFGGAGGADGHTVLSDAWGWRVPPAPVDSTLALVPFSVPELAAFAVLLAGPIGLAWFLRRRPPRKAPTLVPSAAPISPGI